MDRQLPLSCVFIKVFVTFKSQVKNKYRRKKIGNLCWCEYSYMWILKHLKVISEILCCPFLNSIMFNCFWRNVHETSLIRRMLGGHEVMEALDWHWVRWRKHWSWHQEACFQSREFHRLPCLSWGFVLLLRVFLGTSVHRSGPRGSLFQNEDLIS